MFSQTVETPISRRKDLLSASGANSQDGAALVSFRCQPWGMKLVNLRVAMPKGKGSNYVHRVLVLVGGTASAWKEESPFKCRTTTQGEGW